MPTGVYDRSPEYVAEIGEVWRKRHQDPAVIAKRAASHAARFKASCIKCHMEFKLGKKFDKHRDECFNPSPCVFTACLTAKQYRSVYCEKHKAIHDRCRKYGITIDEYISLWDRCSGRCEGCWTTLATHGSNAPKTETVHIDHDEKSGKVRGFLCHRCNVSVGYAQHDVAILERLIQYLKDNS